jgi:hypothetical protein
VVLALGAVEGATRLERYAEGLQAGHLVGHFGAVLFAAARVKLASYHYASARRGGRRQAMAVVRDVCGEAYGLFHRNGV